MGRRWRLCQPGVVCLAALVLVATHTALRAWLPAFEVAAEHDADVGPRALALLLTTEEKLRLVHGSPSTCGYTGWTRGVEARLGLPMSIPELRENDGPQGFRGPPGTSTAYPCAMSMAATFDASLVHAWGREIALEFREKGANVLLGPGLNVARVPRNGRNFEYISGEVSNMYFHWPRTLSIHSPLNEPLSSYVYKKIGPALGRRLGPRERVSDAVCGWHHRHGQAPVLE